MKKIILPLYCIIMLASCGHPMNTIDYNEALIKERGKVYKKMKELVSAIEHEKDSAIVQQTRYEAVLLADSCLNKIDNLSCAGDDRGFKTSIKEQVQYFKKIADKDYEQLFLVLRSTKASESDLVIAKLKWDKLASEADILDAKMVAAQKAFVKANNFQMEE